MIEWSPSAARTFLQCPRKWYFRERFADNRSHDPDRREAFLLSELSNLRALRGKIVDHAITRYAVPRLNKHERVEPDALVNYARRVFQDQLKFAKSNSFRTSTASEFRERPDYCALFEVDYGLSLTEDAVKKASDDVETSLRNFVGSEIFQTLNEDKIHAVAQRTLRFSFADSTIHSTPDLIVFSKTKRPFIVDWKVELPLYKDHWLQLAMYAYALSKVSPHKDFPSESHMIIKDPLDIDLFEFQLLHNRVNPYKLTGDDLVDLENYIHATVVQMARFQNGNPAKALDPEEIPTTFRAGICAHCNFRKICWREQN